MTSRKPRITLSLAMATLGLLVASCNRQSATTKTDASPPAPETSVATSGTSEQNDSINASQSAAAAPDSRAAAGPRDPESIKALEKMGDYLRTLKTFQIRSETNRDEVLDDGQNVEFDGVVDLIVQRPNRLRAEVTNDKQQRLYFYNGNSLSIWARRLNYYTTVPAPSTIRELADTLTTKYDIELPLVDLFYWSDRNSTAAITSAVDLGPSQVDGVTCEHYAYRQDGADWQVWIQLGDYPLPRKVVIRTTSDDARPRYASIMNWNLAPSINDAAFNFVPPPDAKRIALVELKSGGADSSSGH